MGAKGQAGISGICPSANTTAMEQQLQKRLPAGQPLLHANGPPSSISYPRYSRAEISGSAGLQPCPALHSHQVCAPVVPVPGELELLQPRLHHLRLWCISCGVVFHCGCGRWDKLVGGHKLERDCRRVGRPDSEAAAPVVKVHKALLGLLPWRRAGQRLVGRRRCLGWGRCLLQRCCRGHKPAGLSPLIIRPGRGRRRGLRLVMRPAAC